jgi:hypothetical protein
MGRCHTRPPALHGVQQRKSADEGSDRQCPRGQDVVAVCQRGDRYGQGLEEQGCHAVDRPLIHVPGQLAATKRVEGDPLEEVRVVIGDDVDLGENEQRGANCVGRDPRAPRAPGPKGPCGRIGHADVQRRPPAILAVADHSSFKRGCAALHAAHFVARPRAFGRRRALGPVPLERAPPRLSPAGRAGMARALLVSRRSLTYFGSSVTNEPCVPFR